MDNGPTYAQLGRIGHWLGELTNRIESELQAIQSRGPTRISGMDIELDRAAEAAVRKWAGELWDIAVDTRISDTSYKTVGS